MERPRVTDPRGQSLVRLAFLQVDGLEPRYGANQIVRVRGSDVYLKAYRHPDGRFALQTFLPAEEGEPGKIPFQVALDRVMVDYEGGPANARQRRRLFSRRVFVTGLGDDFDAQANVRIQDVGGVAIALQQTRDKAMFAEVQVPKPIQIAPLMATLRSDLPPDIALESGAVQGRAWVRLPKNAPARFAAELQTAGRNFRYQTYRLNEVDFRGLVTQGGAAGRAQARMAGARADFQGSARFGAQPQAGGRLNATLTRLNDLPPSLTRSLPRDLTITGARYQGWVAYAQQTPRYRGAITADRVRYQQETLDHLAVDVDGDHRSLRAQAPHIAYRGVQGQATGEVSFRGPIAAALRVPHVDLGRLGVKGLTGQGEGAAVVRGTLSRPTVDFVARGNGAYAAPKRPKIELRGFSAAGTYANQTLSLRRGAAFGPQGLVVAHGDAGDNGMAIDFTGRGILLSAIAPELGGALNAKGRITGTLKNPVATGLAEAYGIEWQGEPIIPAAQTRFRVTLHDAHLTELEAVRGTTIANADVGIAFDSQVIKGIFSARNFMLSDLSEEEVVGTANISHGELGGTLANPTAHVGIEGQNIVVRGIKLDNVIGVANFANGLIDVPDLRANVLDGAAQLTAQYDIHTQKGRAELRADQIAIADLGPEISDELALDGRTSFIARASLADSRIAHAEVSAGFQDIHINGTGFGGGSASAQYADDRITGDFAIGTTERYIQLTGISAPLDGGEISGDLDVTRVALADLVATAQPYLERLPFDTRDSLRRMSGDLSIGARINGDIRHPAIDLNTFEVPDLAFDGRSMGALAVTGKWNAQRVQVDQASLRGDVGFISLHGSAEPEGAIDIDGEISRLDLAKLSEFVPPLTGRTGLVTAPFVVDGQTRTPRVLASVQTEGLLLNPADEAARAVNLSFDRIELLPTANNLGEITFGGIYRWIGYQGNITGTIPFDYSGKIPDDVPLEANLTIAERPLREVAELSTIIDSQRTDGTLSGGVTVSGPTSNLSARGNILTRADAIFVKSIDTAVHDFTADITLANRVLSLSSKGQSAFGGDFQANASIAIPYISDLIATNGSSNGPSPMDRLLASAVTGSVTLNDFRHEQRFAQGGNVRARANGHLDMSGPLRSPLIAGDFRVSGIDGSLPQFAATESGEFNSPIDPRFNIQAEFDQAHFRLATADANVRGSATIAGRLSAPDVDATVEIVNGSMRLPGGVIRLDPGGTVMFTYDWNTGAPVAHAVVDLEGRTAVSEVTLGGMVERYDVYVLLRGDLLQEGLLSVSATSDPPGLSQDRILGLIGQADILEALGANPTGAQASEALRTALTSFALPALIDPYTQRIASSLGLDYLSLDYNPFDQVSVTVAKALNRSFSIQGRRQLSEPQPGFPIRYDLRLVYRSPRARGILARLNFSIGTDQDTPIKFAVDYSVRF